MSHDKDIELPLLDGKSKSHKKGQTSSTEELPENFALLLRSDFSANKFQKVKPSFQYYTYTDMLPLSRLVNSSKTPITYDQLPLPYENFNIESKVHQLTYDWQEEKRLSKEPSFMKACLQTHKQEFRNTFILIFFLVTINILNTFILGKIMNAITMISLDEETDQEETIFYALAFVVVYIFCHLLENWWSYHGLSFGVSSRLAITGLMYKKLNNVALSSLQEINTGKVLNLLTNDMNDLDAGSGSVTTMFLAPYSILLSCSLIWSYFGFHTIVSMVILVVILMSAIRLSKLSEGPRKEKNLITDQRVKYTNEFIENIRLIKLYAWEKPLSAIIQDLRDKEVVQLKKLAHIDSMARTLTESGVFIGVLFMCITYVITGGVLTPEKVYTAFLVLGFAKFWIILAFHYGRMFLVGVKLTNKRLEEVLSVKETSSPPIGEYLLNSSNLNSEPIKFRKFIASWKQDKPCLHISDLTVQPREFVALIGKIGSGKSTFLLSFLKEIPITSGQISFRGSLAYVEQEPIIFSGSVKYNILFGREFDDMLYQKVLQATNLEEDLQQFDNSDETIVGERGVTLSGGQKARLSLARALYSQSDIYLLDDPLSAVDSRVGKIIFERAIKQLLKDKTVLLVTHHLDYAKEADRVIVMKDGGIEAQGKFEDLVGMNLDLLQVFSKKEDMKPEENLRRKSSVLSDDREEASENLESHQEEKKPVVTAKEETTIVSNQTYWTYLRESQNYSLALALLGIFALTQILVIVFTKFIGYWAQVQNEYNSEEDEEFSNINYILFSLITMVAILCLSYIKAMLTFKFLLDANSKLHEKMLYKISRTFVAFFDATPIGSIINRFSNDLGTLDRGNFPIIYDLMDLFFALAFYLLYLCFINFFIAIPAIIVIYSLNKVKDFFAKPSLELKRVELTSRSPIFSEISSTLHGLLIIRVYQQSQRFIDNFLDLLYKNSRAYTSVLRTNRIFSICLQTLLYLLCVSGVLLFIFIAYYSDIEPGVFGLALFYLITLANTSTWAIRQSIFLDINMQSAQRIQQYCILPEEAPSHLQNKKNSSDEGRVEFKNVHLKYPNTSNYALNGLSFTVEPGTKIGIVGRTGAGKSSIIQALFRIVEIEKKADSYIHIDQTDISTLGLETLRKNISILPQTPVVFTGTIRRNLDPFGMIPEEHLWEALEQASLKGYVKSLEKGLDTDMSVSSSVFSVGQKQLICLARAILQKSKIVILDEATANVDVSTDSFIQEKINDIFKGCVVLTIAHRLSTIAHYDKVLVLEKGMKVEYDHPYRLLVEEIGDKEITKQKGNFVEMVKRSGKKVSKEIFNIASTNFMKNSSL